MNKLQRENGSSRGDWLETSPALINVTCSLISEPWTGNSKSLLAVGGAEITSAAVVR